MAIKDFDIEQFKEYTRRERRCKDVCNKFGINILEFGAIVASLKETGTNIILDGTDENACILNLDERDLSGDNYYTIDIGKDTEFKTLVISDTRLGSKYQQLTRLNAAYVEAYRQGYRYAIVLGDISEGLYPLDSEYYPSLFKTTTDSQVDYIIENYPYIEGMKTLFITGDRDWKHKKSVDIGKAIEAERDDMIYLGNKRCTINLRKTKILAQHLKVGDFNATTVSLKAEKAMKAMRSEEKVDLILDGHIMVDQQMTSRKMEEIQLPSMVATTPKIRKDAVSNNVGYVLLKINLYKDGRFRNKEATFAPYYQTDKDDYNTVKPLNMYVEDFENLIIHEQKIASKDEVKVLKKVRGAIN